MDKIISQKSLRQITKMPRVPKFDAILEESILAITIEQHHGHVLPSVSKDINQSNQKFNVRTFALLIV